MTKMQPIWLALLLSACTPQTQTPAPWFEEATGILQEHYYGLAVDRLPALIEQHKRQLKNTCQDSCTPQQQEKALQDLLKDLGDKHTLYRNPQETQDDQLITSGTGGAPSLGVRLGYLKDRKLQVVLMVQKNGPADRAGLKRGDAIRRYNQQTFPTDSLKAFQKTVRTGKPVLLDVLRSGKNQTLSLQGSIQPPFQPELLQNGLPEGTGVLRIPDMNVWEGSSGPVHDLIRKAQNQNLHTLIVDLRNNPGGFVWEMLSIASAFVPKVEVVNLHLNSREHLVAENGKVKNGLFYLPMVYKSPKPAHWTGKTVVLVNAKTGSAAEYLAYILQQHHALVIGENTRGLLNTSTTTHGLSNLASLQVTVSRTMNANGAPYPQRVTPDLPFKDDLTALVDSGTDPMLQKAVKVAPQTQPLK